MSQEFQQNVALVTGANQGIGFETVRQLSLIFDGTVYLTARDPQRGIQAVDVLRSEGLMRVRYLQLDVLDKRSIERARDFIQRTHQGLQVLVNNAGVAEPYDDDISDETLKRNPPLHIAQHIIATNFNGLIIVNVTSGVGSITWVNDPEIRARLLSDSLCLEELQDIVRHYVLSLSTKDGEDRYVAGRAAPYAISKIAVTVLTRLQQTKFNDELERDIIVNAFAPGTVPTAISGYRGTLSVQDAARQILDLALLKANSNLAVTPRGQYVKGSKVCDWSNGEGGVDRDTWIKWLQAS